MEQEPAADRKAWFARRMPWEPLYTGWERSQKAIYADEFVPESELPRVGEKVRYKCTPSESAKNNSDKKDAV